MRKCNFICILMVAAGVLSGCHRTPEFNVNGHITEACNQVLYLEHTGLVRTTVIDSCTLKEEGAFHFTATAPAYPDFYRLRLGNKNLVLAVDSTETISIEATLSTLPYTTQIQGSASSIKIAQLRETLSKGNVSELRDMAQQMIIANPRSTEAYYALFIQFGGKLLWDVMDAKERRLFQAVATAYHIWMPGYDRSKALYRQISEIIAQERAQRESAAMQQFIQSAENAFLDITLFDNYDNERSLSTLKGKVILLDFSMTQMERTQGYIFGLRELYDRYHAKGLEIYSVSVDPNYLAWQDAVENLPWINVYAPGSIYDDALRSYNVLNIPTMFVLDRKGNVQGRFEDFQSAETAILRYL